MSKVFCRYRKYYCNSGFKNGLTLNNLEGETNICDNCGKYLPNDDRYCTDSPQERCLRAFGVKNQFERELKAYELDTHEEYGYFKSRGIYLDIRNIDYLEIDGQVIINYEDDERTVI